LVDPYRSETRRQYNLKTLHRHISQEVCPWNVKFAEELPEGSAFSAREFIAGKDARTVAREILAMDQAEYAAAFKGSAMKRAKLWMLQRNACVVLGNVGTADDLAALQSTQLHEQEVVREHAARALASAAATRAATSVPLTPDDVPARPTDA